jgi:hypothetical protein
MTDKEKIDTLTKCFGDIYWMSIRYAHGRQTYAPSTVRNAINDFKKVHPEWKPKKDITIKAPPKDPYETYGNDYLNDIYE